MLTLEKLKEQLQQYTLQRDSTKEAFHMYTGCVNILTMQITQIEQMEKMELIEKEEING